jgi:hypothetical protein
VRIFLPSRVRLQLRPNPYRVCSKEDIRHKLRAVPYNIPLVNTSSGPRPFPHGMHHRAMKVGPFHDPNRSSHQGRSGLGGDRTACHHARPSYAAIAKWMGGDRTPDGPGPDSLLETTDTVSASSNKRPVVQAATAEDGKLLKKGSRRSMGSRSGQGSQPNHPAIPSTGPRYPDYIRPFQPIPTFYPLFSVITVRNITTCPTLVLS